MIWDTAFATLPFGISKLNMTIAIITLITKGDFE